jgi:hypothetical protein
MILPVLLFIVAMVLLVNAGRRVSGPVVKISREGLWTRKSGFYSWSEIRSVNIKKETYSKTSSTYLVIFLKGTEEKELFDFKVEISELSRFSEIEQSISKMRNEN